MRTRWISLLTMGILVPGCGSEERAITARLDPGQKCQAVGEVPLRSQPNFEDSEHVSEIETGEIVRVVRDDQPALPSTDSDAGESRWICVRTTEGVGPPVTGWTMRRALIPIE